MASTRELTNNGLYGSYNPEDDYQPCSKKIMPSLFAWFLLLSTSSAYFTLVLPMYIELIGLDNLHIFITILVAHSVLFLYVVLNFLIATFMDPGRFPKVDITHGLEENNKLTSNNQSTTYKNVLINDINVRMKWCTTCQFYRPPRSSHCGVCNACIDTMDHHCPWVCNCIARRNYKYFLQFLVSLTIHMLIILGLSVVLVLNNKENLTHIPVVCSFVLIVIISVLILPIGGLTVFHLVLVSRGRTTNEQVTGKFRTGVNPFDEGCIKNWRQTVCTPIPLSYIKFKQRKQRERENYQTQLLIAKYKMYRQGNGITQSASLKTATNKLANNSTNSIIYTTKQVPTTQATNKELTSLIKKSALKPLREDEVDETSISPQPPAFPTKFEAKEPQQPVTTNQQSVRKKTSKSSSSTTDPDYVYDNAHDAENGLGDRIWLDRNKHPTQLPNKTSANLYKNNANFAIANSAHLQNGSYRAMDKNVGTNLDQHLSRGSSGSNKHASSNSRLKYQVVDKSSDLIIKPMNIERIKLQPNLQQQQQQQQQRHVSTKHIFLSNNSSASDEKFTVIDVRPTSGGQRNGGNGYISGEPQPNGRPSGKSSSKRPSSSSGTHKKSSGERNGGGGLLLMQPQQSNPTGPVRSNRSGESRTNGHGVVKKSRQGGTGNGGHAVDNEFDSYEITV